MIPTPTRDGRSQPTKPILNTLMQLDSHVLPPILREALHTNKSGKRNLPSVTAFLSDAIIRIVQTSSPSRQVRGKRADTGMFYQPINVKEQMLGKYHFWSDQMGR